MNHAISSFLSGCGAAKLLFAAKQVDDLVERGNPNSSFFALINGAWTKYPTNVGWPAITMAVARQPGQPGVVVAVSPYGDFWEVQPATLAETTGQISQEPLQARSLSSIDNVIYLCGMGRAVLRRNGSGAWLAMGPPAPPIDDDTVIGFEDIAGYSSREMYAVGWQGEIWVREDEKWRRLDSPVSANLNAVCCAEDARVYVVGDGGAMLRGRDDAWSVIDTGLHMNLMDVAFHEGKVYVVTDYQILKLADDTLVADDDFADPGDRPATCLLLFKVEDSLFSMGPKDLFRHQGGAWQRLV